MFTMVVGECSTGKSQYLSYLRKTVPDTYYLGVDDGRALSVDYDLVSKVFDDGFTADGFVDETLAMQYMTDMCRTCSTLLVDEIGLHLLDYDDGRVLNAFLSRVGRYKNVVSVSHDAMKLTQADYICTVSWDNELPVLHEVTLDEAEKIIYG